MAQDLNWEQQLRKGLTELCVLVVLREQEAYGYELLQRLQRIKGMSATEGTVYPLLARLLKAGALRQRTVASKSGPPRRYYRLTANGRKRLDKMFQHFDHMHDGISACMRDAEAAS